MNSTDHYKIRCKCSVCGRTQVRKITDLLNGAGCFIGSIKQGPCRGQLSYYSDDPEDAAGNAIAVLGYLNATLMQSASPMLQALVDSVVDDVQTWGEAQATPREMGWVGQNGLP